MANILKKNYGMNRHLVVVQKALGTSEGMAEMKISDINVISSLSPDWIDAVKKSGRFSDLSWHERQTVQMTTLDRLIEQYGIPSFIKIDVEGFEYEVVRGLSQPVHSLSLEFTPEFLESTYKCIDHLQSLGSIRLNYSLEETMRLALDQWVAPEEMVRILDSFRNNNKLFGDVYVQFP